MKYLYALLFLLLVACQPRVEYVPVPQPVPQPVYIPQEAPPAAPQAAPAPKPALTELGPVEFKIFMYGAREATGSVNPNVPLEYRIKVKQAVSGSPPVTAAFPLTISMVVMYSDGTYELYGTEDLSGIQPSNVIMYDPSLGSWVNTKGIAQGSIGTQRFVIVISLNGKTKIIQDSVNVR